MAHRNRNSRRRDSAPGWVWMLFGLGLGLIIAIGVYLRVPPATIPAASAPAAAQTVASTASARSTEAASTARPSQAATERSRPATKPAATAGSGSERFEFYEILPQFEVVVPEDDPPQAAAAATRARPRPAETPGSFLLQAGSFSAAADADRLQANLALLGVESHVQRVTIDSATFNRVRIGPIGDMDAAKRTQRRLRDAGIDTLLMQVPK
jgi:cell division protein FtsN